MKTRARPIGIRLSTLLTRRRTNLSKFLSEQGITTYELLSERCDRMGVEPPTREEFSRHSPQEEVSSPTEGVVVVEPPAVFLESSGEELEDLNVTYLTDPHPPVKQRRKKKP